MNKIDWKLLVLSMGFSLLIMLTVAGTVALLAFPMILACRLHWAWFLVYLVYIFIGLTIAAYQGDL